MFFSVDARIDRAELVRLPAQLFAPATRRSVKLGIGYAVARQHSTSWHTPAYDDNNDQIVRVHRTAARPDAAEGVARLADAVGATTDSNARSRRRQRDGCTTRPRRNWQESQEAEEEERDASMAYLR